MVEDNTIKTGVQTNNETGVDVDADAYAYVDDGEHAFVYAVREENPSRYWVTKIACEAGLCDVHTDEDLLRTDDDTDAKSVAREFAESDPETRIETARDYWADK